MPLLHRKAWQPDKPPSDLDASEEVFVIELTGEVFRSYEAFLRKKEQYGEAVWACKYSGRGGMTFEEAQQAEERAEKQLASFPADLEEQVCRAVHHSTKKIEELVGSIYDSLRPAAAPAEQPQQQQQQEGEAAAAAAAAGGEQQAGEAAEQQQSPSPFGSKENKPQQGAPDAAAAAAEKAGGGNSAPEPEAAGGAGEEAASAEPVTAKKAEAAGGAGKGKEGERSGRKGAKTPKAPVSRFVLRAYIVHNAEPQGPEHAAKQAWVVRPKLRQRFGLPDEMPAELVKELEASVKAPKAKKPNKQLDAPKGLGGTTLPSKKELSKKEGKKAAAADGAAGPSGSAQPAAAGDGTAAKEKAPMVRVEAKPLEEVKKQYKEGTLKHVIVEVLKSVRPEALTVQGIVDKAKALGIREFEEKEKNRVATVLSTDPNFLRLSKGAYSLHCFHPDKEQLVRAHPPKESKKAAAGGVGATTPSVKGAGGGEAPTPGGDGAGTSQKEAVPMVRVEAKSWEEVEKQYKEGTLKHALVAVLAAVKPQALTVQGMVDKGKEMELAVLEEKQKSIGNALASDPNFLRLSKGAYSLHCFHPDKEQLVRAHPPKESKKAAGEGGEAATPAAGKAEPEKEAVPMIRVEPKTWEEVEKQYREGTVKHAIVVVLKAVQPQALTVQGMVDKGKEMELTVLEEKQKSIAHALASDPNFLRLSKGAYSLHCFHPDKEQLVRAHPPKKPEDGATPAAGEGAGSAQKEEKEAVPMIRVEPKTWEEVEKQYREGTVKQVIVQVLKAVQPEALSVQAVIEKAKELGIRDFEEKQKAAVGQALASDPNFLRLSKGAYSLHCFHPDKEQLVRDPQHKKRKLGDLEGEEGDERGSKQAKGAEGAGDEADSITKAEQHVKLTQRALKRHRTELEKAQAEYDAAKAAFEEDKKRAKKDTPAKKERLSDIHIPAAKLAEFEVPEGEREFKGESDDRKGLMEFRQKLQAHTKELAKAKEAFLKAERAKIAKELLDSSKESKTVEANLRKAERALEQERRLTESAEKAAAAAEKKLEKEKERLARGEERAREREEREKQKLAEREEREKRRAEAAKAKEEAKRYPMEDLELLAELQERAKETGEEAPAEDVEQPAWMTEEESQRLSSALYVADLVTQFSKQLGCKALHYDQLEAALADATSTCPSADDDFNAGTLHAVYERLIRVILDDLRAEDQASAQEKRWASLLAAGTWPEVLRRFVLTRSAEADAEGQPSLKPDPQALMGASMLAFDSIDTLTHDQHLALLRFLCDTLLDSEKMRGVLQKREDEALEAMRDVREELAENRKALKELADQEKEERKRKREERRKAEEEEKAAAEAAAAAAAAAAEGGAGEGEAGGQQQEQKGKEKEKEEGGAKPMDVDGEQAEPSFELPERLREYTGPQGDKKALVQWRHEQQAEKRRLDKERQRWMADQLRRQRELEAQERAARETEKAKQKEKEEKEEAILRAQEALEDKLEKYSVRRAPLGADRHHRRYWWGLAGHRPVVWVEDMRGRWGSFSTVAEIDALLAGLDRRGVRELALAEAIEKRFQTISLAMQRAERAAAAGPSKAERKAERERERAEPPRRSGRQTQQTDFFDPATARGKRGEGGLADLFGPAECTAVEAAAEEMEVLQKDAGSLIAAPASAGSWKDWAAALKAAVEGKSQGAAKPTAAAVRSALQASLQQLEEALLAKSVGGLVPDADGGNSSEEEAEEGVGEREESAEGASAGAAGRSREQSVEVLDVVDELFSASKRPDVAFLWKTQRERNAWQTDLKQAATAARIAYSAAVLSHQAEPMLASLGKAAAAAAKGSGGGRKGSGAKGPAGIKAAAAEARANSRAAGSAAAAASSRPVSRTNSVAAAMDASGSGAGGSKAGGSGKGSGGGKRKGAPPPAPLPENARATRARR